jgi:hypothetical protein
MEEVQEVRVLMERINILEVPIGTIVKDKKQEKFF